jgi:hypothetical protein
VIAAGLVLLVVVLVGLAGIQTGAGGCLVLA